jgi:protein-disulfide isomerase
MKNSGGGAGKLQLAANVASIVSAVLLTAMSSLVIVNTYARIEVARGSRDGFNARPPLSRGRDGAPVLGPAPIAAPPILPLIGMSTRTNDTLIRPAGAKVVIVEFSDFQCPFCRRFANDIYPELKRQFIDSGRVAYMVRSFPLENTHPLALKASEAAECALAKGRYWQMRERLFATNLLMEADLAGAAVAAGLDMSEFQQCLGAAKADVPRADHLEGVRLGVRSTPTFIIGRLDADGSISTQTKLMGALPLEAFRAAIQKMVDEVGSHAEAAGGS